jgi:hypothetical protein
MTRYVHYELTEYHGPTNEARVGTIANLLSDRPYGFLFGVIPPLDALNDLLSGGSDGGGMSPGVEWEPFTIDRDEYEGVVDDLLRGCPTGLTVDNNPRPPATYDEWTLSVAGDRLVRLPTGVITPGPATHSGRPPCIARRIAALSKAEGRPPARYFRYTLKQPLGGRYPTRLGSLANFVSDLPFLLRFQGMPPRTILDDLMRRGSVDLGARRGGADWKPFEVDEGQFALAVEDRKRGTLSAASVAELPPGVTGFDAWLAWRDAELARYIERVRSRRSPG